MTTQLDVHFRGMKQSTALEARIADHVQHLTDKFKRHRLLSCHVTVELLNQRAGKSGAYRVIVDAKVPGHEIVVGRQPGRRNEFNDAYAAINEAFEVMERRLRDFGKKLRQEVKHHEPSTTEGSVVRLFPQDGYGFIATADGREIYFSENAVLNGVFDRLEPGSEVRFAEELGEDGPQASTVHVVKLAQPKELWTGTSAH